MQLLQETTQIYIEEIFQIPTTTIQPDVTTSFLHVDNVTHAFTEFNKIVAANEVTYELSADASRHSRQNLDDGDGKKGSNEESEDKDKDEKNNDEEAEVTTVTDSSREGRQEESGQQSSEESSEEDGGDANGGIGGLISAFLGSLSRVRWLATYSKLLVAHMQYFQFLIIHFNL